LILVMFHQWQLILI